MAFKNKNGRLTLSWVDGFGAQRQPCGGKKEIVADDNN